MVPFNEDDAIPEDVAQIVRNRPRTRPSPETSRSRPIAGASGSGRWLKTVEAMDSVEKNATAPRRPFRYRILTVGRRTTRRASRRDRRRKLEYSHPELRLSNSWLRATGIDVGDRTDPRPHAPHQEPPPLRAARRSCPRIPAMRAAVALVDQNSGP